METIVASKIIVENAELDERRDEKYVIRLCNEILDQEAQPQYKFDFLRGDTGRKLPVDAYYEKFNLVVEYCERQHTESVPFFDHKMTCSGVSRAKQRAKYDQLRKDLLPQNGIKLVTISYSDFDYDSSKRIKRNPEHDKAVIKQKLVEKKVLKGNN